MLVMSTLSTVTVPARQKLVYSNCGKKFRRVAHLRSKFAFTRTKRAGIRKEHGRKQSRHHGYLSMVIDEMEARCEAFKKMKSVKKEALGQDRSSDRSGPDLSHSAPRPPDFHQPRAVEAVGDAW